MATTYQTVKNHLKNTSIVWIGSKATDAKNLQRFGKKLSVFSVVGSGKDISKDIGGFSLEDELNKRIDYDRFSWDQLEGDFAAKIVAYIEKLKRNGPVLIVPFSSCQFISNIGITVDDVMVATNFFYFERAFNYKPWVEFQFKKIGLPTLKWENHISGYEKNVDTSGNSWLTRSASSSGGLGMVQSFSLSKLQKTIHSKTSSDISSTAIFLENAFSLNITACVFPSGKITIHPISVQIIGADICTDRKFGYCGNDFSAVNQILTDKEVQLIENMTIRVGKWLCSYNYIGVFGLDIMKVGNKILISELNARFQASSHLGAELMMNAGFNDIYTDHIAAYLGIEPQEDRPDLLKIISSYIPLAQIFCYNTSLNLNQKTKNVVLDRNDNLYDIELLPCYKKIQHHALLFRMIVKKNVMSNGKTLDMEFIEKIANRKKSLIFNLETVK